MGMVAVRILPKAPVGGGGPDWPNAPVGWTTIVDMPFSIEGSPSQNPEGWYWYDPATGSPILDSDGSAPHSPSAVARWIFPVGQTSGTGAGSIERLVGQTVTSHYAGFWTKVDSDFENPLGFKQGFYPYGDNFGYALIIEGESQGAAAWTMRFEGNAMNAPSNVVQKPLTTGVWHQLEVLWDAPTQVMKFWMDNVLVGNHALAPWSDTFTYWRFYPIWGPNLPDVHATLDSFIWVEDVGGAALSSLSIFVPI